MNIGDLLFSLGVDGSHLEQDITKQATGAAEGAGTKAGKTLGQRMSTAAAGGLTALGAAGGVIFAGAVEAGANFEDQLRTINTVAHLSDDELNNVGDSIQALSRETGKTTDDLTSGFYDLVSAGVPADKAMKVLKDSAVLATGALGTTGESVDLVTSALGAYGMAADESTRVTDIFAQAVADGKTTVADLAGGISTVAPIAAAAGVSLEEVAAQTAIMTLKGDSASQAMTRIRNAISALMTPNAELAKISKETGINFAELAKQKGLAVALDTLRKATKGNNEEFGKALGSSEALTLAFAVTGDNAGAMADELGRVTEGADKGGVALGQYTEKSKSGVEQGKRFSAVLNTLVEDFGGVFSGAAPVLVTLNNLAPAMRGLISPAKIVGGLVGGLAGKLASGLGSIGPKIGPALAKSFASAEIGTRLETLGLKAQTYFIKGMIKKDAIGFALGDALDAVKGNSKVQAASDGLGKFMGSSLGKALSVAFAAVAIVELAKTYDEISRQLRDQATQVTADTNTFIQTATKEQLEAQLKTVEEAQRQLLIIAAIPGVGVIAGDSLTELKKQADDLRASIAAADAAATHLPNTGDHIGTSDYVSTGEHAGKDLMEGTANGIAAGAPLVNDATAKMMGDASSLAEEMASHGGFKAGYAIPEQTAEGMRSNREKIFDAIDALGEAMKHQMTPWGQASRITGFLVGKKLQEGLHSADPAVRRQAEETRKAAEERLAKLITGSGKAAKAAGQALADGLHSKNPQIRAEAQRVKALVDAKLASMVGPAGTDGTRVGNAFANNVRAAITARLNAGIKIHADAYIQYHDNGHGHAVGGWATAGVPTWVNEHTTNSEVFVPSTSGRFLTHAEAINALHQGGGGGDTYEIPVMVQGALPVRTARDVANEVRRAVELGQTVPRELAPMYRRREAARP